MWQWITRSQQQYSTLGVRAMAKTHGITRVESIVLVLIVGMIAFIWYPIMQPNRLSCFDATLAGRLKEVGLALSHYASDHHGSLPKSLDQLCPKYFDSREMAVLNPPPDHSGMEVTLNYWHPARLGDANTPVAELTPAPRRDKESRRSWVLWGDLRVERRK
jgi:hypothetical protein